MGAITLWGCFAAVQLGLGLLIFQNWNFYGRGRFIGRYLMVWAGIATVIGLYNMLRPGAPLPAWFLPLAIVSTTVLFSITVVRRSELREIADRADLTDWYGLQRLRVYFGAVILIGASLGLLPWPFALAAGIGDVVVGLSARFLERRAIRHSAVAWLFTLVGMADLINAGRMGAQIVVPWLLERQLPGFLLMLPLLGVPLMLANHVQTIRYLLRTAAHERSRVPIH